jgi:hypothetical protein
VGDDSSNPTFKHFTALKSVSGANIGTVGALAFLNCYSLTSVTFNSATSIGYAAFAICTGLTTVSLPAATSIGSYAFHGTGTGSLTLTLGSAAPPTLGTEIFYLISSKTVIVKVPLGATGYHTSELPVTLTTDTTNCWGNAFRGKGWDGATSTYLTGTVNSNVDLTITDTP